MGEFRRAIDMTAEVFGRLEHNSDEWHKHYTVKADYENE
jgi:hypothetical protein